MSAYLPPFPLKRYLTKAFQMTHSRNVRSGERITKTPTVYLTYFQEGESFFQQEFGIAVGYSLLPVVHTPYIYATRAITTEIRLTSETVGKIYR